MAYDPYYLESSGAAQRPVAINPAIKYDAIGIDVQECCPEVGGPCLNHFSLKNGELGLPEDILLNGSADIHSMPF